MNIPLRSHLRTGNRHRSAQNGRIWAPSRAEQPDRTASLRQVSNQDTECVEFVRQAAGAPPTIAWKRGALIMGALPGTIRRGTVIATFDDKGRYPIDGQGKHAAIYLSHDLIGIRVLD